MTTDQTTISPDYQRALAAEPRLRPVEALVDALCTLRRPTDRLCAGCVWEQIVKPLVSPYLGWGRAYAPRPARDPDPTATGERLLKVRTGLMAEMEERRLPATTDTERWLRTSEAYDAVTDVLLARLDAADPANGHGIGREEEQPWP
jgi:hypothetical protein